MNSVADVWANVLQQLKKDLSETTIATWFDELSAVDIRENTFLLYCPNDFKKRYIESLFLKNIKAALQDIFSIEFEVEILDEKGLAEFQGNAPKHQSERFTSAEFTFDTFVVGPSNKLAYAASQAGWIVAEAGRQPWAIQELMPVGVAASKIPSGSVTTTFILFLVLFTALLVAELSILFRQIKLGPEPEK